MHLKRDGFEGRTNLRGELGYSLQLESASISRSQGR